MMTKLIPACELYACRYAALDALVSPLIIEKLFERHPELKQNGTLLRLCSNITV